jgi:dTDP-4-dehydrorhamnose 3,5-epimerase
MADVPRDAALQHEPDVKHIDGVQTLLGDRIVDGVRVVPLRQIPDERGTILHMLRVSDPHFEQFGEIYFTTIYRNIIKGWHKHQEMTLNYACIFGRIKLVLWDDRPSSVTERSLTEIVMGSNNHCLVTIPPGVWSGFKGMTEPFAIVANCSTHPHDPTRTTRMDPFDSAVPYDWDVRHR